MTFLNLALLGGVLAFNIPLIIHLLNKSRYRRVDWGAMFLLEQVMRQNLKRVRLEQVVMLLVRCAIPALLALAMAQPVLTGWEQLVGDAPGSTVVMLDASYSMQARDQGAGGQTCFDHAVEQSQGVFDAMPSGSRGQVIRVGGGFDPVTQTMTPELDRLRNKLAGLQPDRAIADGPAALQQGVARLADAGTTKRDLVLVSDFQRLSWADDSGLQRQRLLDQIERMPVKPTIALMPVGTDTGRNLSIMSAELSPQAIGVGQRVRVTATVFNTSDRDAPDTPVTLRVNGVEHETQRLSIDAGESVELIFFHRFDRGGPQTLEVALSDGVLAADDVYRLAVNVIKSLPVLLVSGDRVRGVPPRPFPENETDFLELALRPFAASADVPLADLIEPTVDGPDSLTNGGLAGQRVVVLANVPRLTDVQAQRLYDFVKHGGALLIFPGDRVEVDVFNKLFRQRGRLIAPATIEGIAGKAIGFDDGATPLNERREHPALSLWNDPSNGSLSGVRFNAWYELKPDRGADVIARLSTGHPLLVQHSIGEGVVILGASAIDADWSNLPTTPVYLPLMQRLVAYAATHREPASNTTTGRPIAALLNMPPGRDTLDWQTPDGSVVPRPVAVQGGRWLCTLDDTAQPGMYRLRIPGQPTRVFAVNLPREESDLRRLTDDELAGLAEAIGAIVLEDAQAYAELDETRRHGRPIWRVLWILVLALVFGELLLQQWFGKGGRP